MLTKKGLKKGVEKQSPFESVGCYRLRQETGRERMKGEGKKRYDRSRVLRGNLARCKRNKPPPQRWRKTDFLNFLRGSGHRGVFGTKNGREEKDSHLENGSTRGVGSIGRGML